MVDKAKGDKCNLHIIGVTSTSIYAIEIDEGENIIIPGECYYSEPNQ